MFKHILIPTDGSDLSTAALSKALDFAHEIGAKVTVLSVIAPIEEYASVDPLATGMGFEQYEDTVKLLTEATMEAAMEAEKRHISTCKTIRVEAADPARVIVETADENGCDLIAMGSHGRSGFRALMLGSVTMKVMAQSNIPVLVYRD
jgi:nucleotide-binding universal stress UspA family protein